MIVLGAIMVIFLLAVITGGKSWPFVVFGVLAFAIYKNNRY